MWTKRTLFIFLGLLLAGGVAPAFATDRYFSDCGAGFIWGLSGAGDVSPVDSKGAACSLPGGINTDSCLDDTKLPGTRENPYCLNPGNDIVGPAGGTYSLRNSFMQFEDGGTGNLTTELAPDDNVFLCSEACDTVGASYFPLKLAPGVTTFFKPVTSGTSGHPITIMPYCNGGACETVIFTGDSNFCSDAICPGFFSTSNGNDYSRFNHPTNYLGQNPTPEAGDLQSFLDTNGQQYWRISGGRNDPGGDAARAHLIVERFVGTSQDSFHMYQNPTGWVLDGFEVRRMNSLMWNNNNVGDNDCYNLGGYLMHTDALNGPLVVKDMIIHHICGTWSRNNNHQASATTLEQGNLFYNIDIVQQDFNDRGETWQSNTILDCYQCINFEDDSINVIIQDNIIGCPGVYRVDKGSGRCEVGISLTNGNNGETDVVTHDIIVRRNKVFSQVVGNYGTGLTGWFMNPIKITVNATTIPNNILVENNMVWHTQGWANPEDQGPAIWVKVARATGNEVIVQNNTVYDSKYALTIDGYAAGVDMLVQDNLLYKSNKQGASTVGLTVGANAATSRVKTNLISNGSLGGNIVNNNGTTYTCGTIASFNNGTTRTGNICNIDEPMFITVTSGVMENWDLHLNPHVGNTAFDTGIAGAADDVDGEARPHGGGTDIGADEDYGLSIPPEPGSIIPVSRRPPIRVN